MLTEPDENKVKCYKCQKQLEGDWEMNDSDDFPEGRYLGVKACFYYGETECNLVYPYCPECYKTALINTIWLKNYIKCELQKVHTYFNFRQKII